MRNRAKCRLCNTIIESLQLNDYQTCACGEISIDGGQQDVTKTIARDYDNFIKIDDLGNEIILNPKSADTKEDLPKSAPNKEDLLGMLNEMIKNIEGLPQHAMITSINHYDMVSALILINALFRVK